MTPHDQNDHDAAHELEPLHSRFGDDPDMIELIEYFVTELNGRVGELSGALASGDRATLVRLAHQLKGAAGSYGFPEITDLAGDLEQGLAREAALSDLSEHVESLIEMCRRATSGLKH